jgi:ParB/RepB/Spo0J family partition protein
MSKHTSEGSTPPTLRSVPITLVDPNDWNPRTHVSDKDRDELRADVKAHGIQQPLLLRPIDGGRFEVVAGMQRFDAAQHAGLTEIPALIQTLDDAEAFEAAMRENIQRHDMHPMDEARAFARWKKFDPAFTDEAIADRIGKSVKYVQRRKRLLSLPGPMQDAFLAGAITDAHAAILVSVPDELKEKTFHECFLPIDGRDVVRDRIVKREWAKLAPDVAAPASVQDWVDNHVKYDVQELQERLPDLPTFAKAAGTTGLVELSAQWYVSPQDHKRFPHLLARENYDEVGPGTHNRKICEKAERGVVVHGGRPRPVTFCRRGNQCPVHHAHEIRQAQAAETLPLRGKGTAKTPKPEPSAWELKQRKLAAQQRAYALIKGAALRSVGPTLVTVTPTAALVKQMLSAYEIKEVAQKTGLALSDKTALAVLIGSTLLQKSWNRGSFVAFTKVLGFDFKKFEREQAKAKAAAKKAKAAKGKKAAKKAKAA